MQFAVCHHALANHGPTAAAVTPSGCSSSAADDAQVQISRRPEADEEVVVQGGHDAGDHPPITPTASATEIELGGGDPW